ncbi:MAG: cell envelope integrity protein TolA [Burkholderiales bacterium]|nr:cell envelope integrity protein TolA [Burkholderiales bacterium]MCE7876527.1 cell envelope integrity protein TolA [Betaproteobacteria bacterium PRO3]
MKGERRAGNGSARRSPGRTLALVLAILVHVAFVGVLIWSVRWQSRPPEPIVAELYAPPPKVRAPDPEPKVEPPPPRTEPKVEPPPPPPPPKAEPDQAEIALKAKREEERRERERERLADEKRKADEKRAAEEKRIADEKRKADEKRAAEARERQKRETDAMLAQAQKEATQRAEQDARARVEAEARAKAQAEANARATAQADWIRRIQAKIRGNVTLPPGMPGNPEAVFRVIQLPTGEILDVRLAKSSGVKAYDDAVNRAILKSSPLPRPDRQEMFQRELELKFRPLD